MAYREFEGPDGEPWRVWDVYLSHAERRTGGERRTEDRPPAARERRSQDEPRILMPAELMSGWLCFETDGQRKRLVPVPEGWEHVPVAQLRSWLREATPTPPRRPRA